uniref:Protein kinase domain-containing protein n=1 Tax=Caenorhabditis tropicalis TaxID=1561998 RepID=A0A1I7THH2_9PELO
MSSHTSGDDISTVNQFLNAFGIQDRVNVEEVSKNLLNKRQLIDMDESSQYVERFVKKCEKRDPSSMKPMRKRIESKIAEDPNMTLMLEFIIRCRQAHLFQKDERASMGSSGTTTPTASINSSPFNRRSASRGRVNSTLTGESTHNLNESFTSRSRANSSFTSYDNRMERQLAGSQRPRSPYKVPTTRVSPLTASNHLFSAPNSGSSHRGFMPNTQYVTGRLRDESPSQNRHPTAPSPFQLRPTPPTHLVQQPITSSIRAPQVGARSNIPLHARLGTAITETETFVCECLLSALLGMETRLFTQIHHKMTITSTASISTEPANGRRFEDRNPERSERYQDNRGSYSERRSTGYQERSGGGAQRYQGFNHQETAQSFGNYGRSDRFQASDRYQDKENFGQYGRGSRTQDDYRSNRYHEQNGYGRGPRSQESECFGGPARYQGSQRNQGFESRHRQEDSRHPSRGYQDRSRQESHRSDGSDRSQGSQRSQESDHYRRRQGSDRNQQENRQSQSFLRSEDRSLPRSQGSDRSDRSDGSQSSRESDHYRRPQGSYRHQGFQRSEDRSLPRSQGSDRSDRSQGSDYRQKEIQEIISQISDPSTRSQLSATQIKKNILSNKSLLSSMTPSDWETLSKAMLQTSNAEPEFISDLMVALSPNPLFSKAISKEIEDAASKGPISEFLSAILCAPRQGSEIVATVISIVKSWIKEVKEDEKDQKTVSRCAEALADFTDANQRIWINWTDLAEEIFKCFKHSIAYSNNLDGNTKDRLLDTVIQMNQRIKKNKKDAVKMVSVASHLVVCQRVLSIANTYLQISHKELPAHENHHVTTALLAAIRNILGDYIADIDEMRRMKSLKFHQCLPLIDKWQCRLQMVLMAHRIRYLPQLELLESLYVLHAAYTFDEDRRQILDKILDYTMGVFCNQMMEWMTSGEVPAEKWMIEKNGETGELFLKKVPIFISEDDAKMLLEIGKSLPHVSNASDEDLEAIDKATTVVRSALSPTVIFRKELTPLLKILRDVVCGIVMRMVLTTGRLKEHIIKATSFFFLSDPRFTTTLYTIIKEASMGLRVGSAALSRQQVSSALASALEATTINTEEDKKKTKLKFTLDAMASLGTTPNVSSKMQFVQPLSPHYEPQMDLMKPIFAACDSEYESIFHVIWAIDLARYSTQETVTLSLPEIMRFLVKNYSLRENATYLLNMISHLFSVVNASLLRLRCIISVQLKQHLARFLAAIDEKCVDVDDVIREHEKFVRRVSVVVFVKNNEKIEHELANLLRIAFEAQEFLEDFTSNWHEVIENTVADANIRKARIAEICQKNTMRARIMMDTVNKSHKTLMELIDEQITYGNDALID